MRRQSISLLRFRFSGKQKDKIDQKFKNNSFAFFSAGRRLHQDDPDLAPAGATKETPPTIPCFFQPCLRDTETTVALSVQRFLTTHDKTP